MMGDTALQTSFWLMVLAQTIGTVDMPGRGPRKMPSPRNYIAIVVAWMVLFIVSTIGEGARRGAVALGWLLVLVGMVAGPFGATLVGFFKTVAQNFAVPSVSPTTAPGVIQPTSQSPPTQ